MSKIKVCEKCGKRSIPGLIGAVGYCPYHWAIGVWGKAWADTCYPQGPHDYVKTKVKA